MRGVTLLRERGLERTYHRCGLVLADAGKGFGLGSGLDAVGVRGVTQ